MARRLGSKRWLRVLAVATVLNVTIPVSAEEPDRLPWLDASTAGTDTVPATGGRGRGGCRSELLGGLLGGAIGGALGAQVAEGERRASAAAVGTVIGYLLGAAIGRSVDRLDEACVGPVLERAPDQRTVAWIDAAGESRYEVTPVRTFVHDARYCRDYQVQALVRGQARSGQGTACREAAGRWVALR